MILHEQAATKHEIFSMTMEALSGHRRLFTFCPMTLIVKFLYKKLTIYSKVVF